MSQINIGIIGFGTVGAGVVEVLVTNHAVIASRVGTRIVVKKIADLDIKSDRGLSLEPGLLTVNTMEVIEDPEIEIVVELMGGKEKAKGYILKAMENGKHVVTANKALLAESGLEIYQAAEKNGVNIGFDASVGGGIPIIGAFRHGLSANRIKTIIGILNGTSNFILTRMTREGLPYEQVVQEAVDLGFAEDPPTLDVDGTDAAHKLAILISLVFGSPVSFNDIYIEGIGNLTPDDIRFAGEFGYCIKLLAIAKARENCVEARVHPVMISQDHILSNVNDAYNAVYLEGDFVGPNLYYGLGAGRKPTGSAVASDIINIAKRIRLGIKSPMAPLAHVHQLYNEIKISRMEELLTAYYFRFSAVDRPGILSKIAGILGENEISISSVIQKGRELNGSVTIVMLTHEALEKNVRNAVLLMDKLDILTDKTIMLRVHD